MKISSQKLSLKEQLLEELENHPSKFDHLAYGQLSKPFINRTELGEEIYRVQKTSKGLFLISKKTSNTSIEHPPIYKNSTLYLHDTITNRTIPISFKDFKRTFEEKMKSHNEQVEIDFNLSHTQKAKLCTGKEITLWVYPIPTNTFNPKKKPFQKSFVADPSFFLGKTSVLFHTENQHKGLRLGSLTNKES